MNHALPRIRSRCWLHLTQNGSVWPRSLPQFGVDLLELFQAGLGLPREQVHRTTPSTVSASYPRGSERSKTGDVSQLLTLPSLRHGNLFKLTRLSARSRSQMTSFFGSKVGSTEASTSGE